jgi:predicted protein tyrosine phosphatase
MRPLLPLLALRSPPPPPPPPPVESTPRTQQALRTSDLEEDVVQCPACGRVFEFAVFVTHLEACEAAPTAVSPYDDTVPETHTAKLNGDGEHAQRRRFSPAVEELLLPPATFKGCSEASLVHESWLYVGSSSSARSAAFLAEAKVGWLLNCADDVELDIGTFANRRIEYLRVPLQDTTRGRITPHLAEAHAFMARAQADPEHRALLVHCSAGVSRSGALVIAYLMRSQRRTLLDCLTQVRRRRLFVYPNKRFLLELIRFESTVFGDAHSAPSIPEEALSLHEDQTDLDADVAAEAR